MNKRENVQQEIHFYLLVLLVITMPLTAYALNNAMIIGLGLNWLVGFYYKRKLEVERKDIVLLAASSSFFFLYVIGVAYSYDKLEAWTAVQRKLPLFFLPWIIASSATLGGKRIRFILIAFLASCSCISLLSVIHTIWLNKQLGIEWTYYNAFYFSEDNLTRKFGIHHVYMAMYLCFCEAIIFYLIRSSFSIYRKMALFVLSGFLMLYMFALSSRMAIIIMVILICLGIFLLVKRSFIAKLFFLLSTIAVVFIAGSQFSFIKEKFVGYFNIDINEYTEKYRASNRMMSAKITWDIFKSNWTFGIGPGDVNGVLLKEYEKASFEEGVTHSYNPHNQYLDTGASVGILGLVSLVALILTPFYRSVTERDFISLSFFVIVSFSFITESMLSRQNGAVFFATFLAILSMKSRPGDIAMKF
jgi:O-antigen ligase